MALPDLTFGTARTIGRYFSVVSVVPSALLVLFVFVLAHTGAWAGHPDWSASITAIEKIGAIGLVELGFLSVATGLVLQPLQFSIVQLFEGYWGLTSFAKDLRAARIMTYRKRLLELDSATNQPAAGSAAGESNEVWRWSFKREAARALDSYPKNLNDVMPTRLGNILRRYELGIGKSYGLSPLQSVPYLALVAPPSDVEYLDDQRAQLDLAVRLSFTSIVATGITFLFLWRDGLWLTVAALPYGLAYVFYRGAVVTAREYGTAIATLSDLNRFALYERLHLPLPKDVDEECRLNEKIGSMFAFDKIEDLIYDHPGLPTPSDKRKTLLVGLANRIFRRT